MHDDLETRLRAAGRSVEPSKRPATRRARDAALAELPPPAAPIPSGRAHRRASRPFAPRRPRRLALAAGTAITVLAAVAVVAGGGLLDGKPPSGPSAVAPNASFAVPTESLEDVVSYADHLAVVSVVDERPLPPVPGTDPAADEDYVSRELTVEIEQRLWRRPDAPPVANRFDMVAFGWVERDGDQRPFVLRGDQRLEVGQRYLMPLVRIHGEWGAYPVSTLLMNGNRTANDVNGAPAPPTVSELAGRPLDQATQIVRATKPDPLAVEYSHLPPNERWQAADRERNRRAR